MSLLAICNDPGVPFMCHMAYYTSHRSYEILGNSLGNILSLLIPYATNIPYNNLPIIEPIQCIECISHMMRIDIKQHKPDYTGMEYSIIRPNMVEVVLFCNGRTKDTSDANTLFRGYQRLLCNFMS